MPRLGRVYDEARTCNFDIHCDRLNGGGGGDGGGGVGVDAGGILTSE